MQFPQGRTGEALTRRIVAALLATILMPRKAKTQLLAKNAARVFTLIGLTNLYLVCKRLMA